MEQRIQINKVQPAAYEAMYALEGYIKQSKIDKVHRELIKIRASQINRCAFCINMHTKDALNYGENPQRIFLLDAWRETDLFTEEEKILLQMTEEITLIHREGLTPETYQKALKIFDEDYIAQVIMVIVTINAWNRISVSTHKPVED